VDEGVGWTGAPAERPRRERAIGPRRERLLRFGRSEAAAFRRGFARIGLPAWFVAIDLLWVARTETLGIDARHYQAAATAWLGGGDPWQVKVDWIQYAASPHTLVFYAPTSLLPVQASEVLWFSAGLLAAAWLVRRLELPIWWVAFPPLFHAIWNGNPHSIMLALLVLGTPFAGALAAGLKYYALLPLLAKPRHLAVAIIALLITLPLLPWQLYVAEGLGVSLHLATAWNGSATRLPILIPPVLVALWILRRQGAEWLIVPAVWPGTQFYYQSLALPVVTKRPILAAALALPAPLLAPLAVIAFAAVELWRQRQAPAPTAPETAPA
jgi:hypothetical protein